MPHQYVAKFDSKGRFFRCTDCGHESGASSLKLAKSLGGDCKAAKPVVVSMHPVLRCEECGTTNPARFPRSFGGHCIDCA